MLHTAGKPLKSSTLQGQCSRNW